MKNILLFATALLLLTSCQESLEEKAAREAREVTESKCPMPIGDNMYLDSIVFDIPTLTQTQYFRFTGNSDNDSTVENIVSNNDLKGTLVKELKNTPSYKALMNKGISFRYIYGSTAEPEKTYIDITVTKEDYQ
ncbi:hypothetical protein L6468_08610 [Prevotella communis]|uniref:hypothetical protein n=1 Tax=Prevotella communis TaxID=2913614 RepID=UPI001EDA5B5E|nr:hypothetical protein [Prevotella communis]UKK61066.1 hypothetical protein L6468_08610 [Prevotella communis]